MKRLCSIFLVIAMFVGMFNINVFADDVTATVDCLKEIKILNELGITNLSIEDDLDVTLSRAKLIQYIANAFALHDVTDKIYYSDVDRDLKEYGAINAALEMGILDMPENRLFNPHDPVTLEQICKVLVCATGYKPHATAKSSDMLQYVLMANKLDIAIDVENRESIKLSEAIKMIYNSMIIDVVSAYGATDDALLVRVEDGVNILGLYHNTYLRTGFLESVYGGSVSSMDCEINQVCIDGEKYLLNDVECEDLLARTVAFVYKENYDDTKTILYMEAKDEDDVILIGNGCLNSFSANTRKIEYFPNIESDKVRTAYVSPGAVIIYNGSVTSGSLFDKLSDMIAGRTKGEIRLISNQKENDYVVINAYKTFIASGFNETTQMLYNAYSSTDSIDLSEYDCVKIRSKFNKQDTIPKVFKNVLSVAASDDLRYIDICLSEKKDITISSFSINDNFATINGEEYYLDRQNIDRIIPQLKVGKTIEVMIDIFSEIAYVGETVLADDMIIGYVTAVGISDRAFEDEMVIKLFLLDNSFMVYTLDEKLTIDGVKYKNYTVKDVVRAFPDSEYVSNDNFKINPQIIRFKLNDENLINKIDTYNVTSGIETTDASLTRGSDGSTEQLYRKLYNQFGLLDITDANTKFISVPDVDSDGKVTVGTDKIYPEDYMYSANTPVLKSDYAYYVESYFYSGDYVADVIVYKSSDFEDPTAVYMVDSFKQVYTEEDGVVTELVCYGSEGETSFYIVPSSKLEVKGVKADISSLKQGDIIWLKTDLSQKRISVINKVYDGETKEVQSIASSAKPGIWYQGGSWRQLRQIIKFYPFDARGTILRGTYELYDAYEGITDLAIDTSKVQIVVFDKTLRNNNVYKGSLGDVVTYTAGAESCDIMIACMSYSGHLLLCLIK